MLRSPSSPLPLSLPLSPSQNSRDCREKTSQHIPLLLTHPFLTVGWPELAVIGVVVALIFGPSNIAGMGKDLGKLAGSIKAEAATFSDAMNESLSEADKEYKKGEKEAKAKEDEEDEKPKEKPVPKKKKVDLTDE